MKKQLDTPVAFLSFEDEILFVKMKEGVNLGQPEMEELLKQAVELTMPNKYFAIVDMTASYDSTLEARNFYAESDYSKYRYADAFIVNSLPMRLLVNFFIAFNKPKIPSKMFNNEESALTWVNSLKKEMLVKT
ncbi:MAG: hypothetical protein JNM51_15120 [Bacteroidia bacterium]|nr:hypothetical protein [Bacteroidia bacterium]